MGKKLILVDGNSLIHRAYHALPPLTTVSGQQTNAVYGFTNMLLKLIDQEKPDMMAVAFDKSRVTFRHKRYHLYKAQRERAPENLVSQFALVRELLSALEIPYFEVDDFEADDIIGTLAKQGQAAGLEIVIVTGDKDALQLVDKNVQVLLTRRGITDLEVLDSEGVKAKLGVTPQQVVDYKALTGDSSDNIPGVPGIGPKTATTLLQQFDSLENIYAKLSTIKGRRHKLLAEHKEQAFLSRDLATICCEVPIECSWQKCQLRPPKMSKVGPLFIRLEFNRLLQRLFPQESQTKPTNLPELLKYERLETKEAITSWWQKMKTSTIGFIIVVDHKEKQPQGMALASARETAYVPWNLVCTLGDYLNDNEIAKVTYDIKAGLAMLCQAGLTLQGKTDDVLLASYLLNPTLGGRSLNRLFREYLNLELPRSTKEHTLPDNIQEAIWCTQAANVLELMPVLEKLLVTDDLMNLYREIELPLATILSEMEQTGIGVDEEILNQLGTKISIRMDEVEQTIFSLVEKEFNLNSPKQLGNILFDKLGLPAKKKTKTGYSTDASVLEDLASAHPAIPLILEHRQLAKLKSTYVDGMKAQISPSTGRIHTTFTQTVTATGRLSSQEPNLQNIPVRLELGRQLRKIFVPTKKDWSIISADYSQIELRVLAHISKDPVLQRAFHLNEDIHTRTAAEIFGIETKDVTPELRSRAKAVNFGIIYGISDFGLARSTGVSRQEAHEYIEGYFRRYQGVHDYMKKTVEQARKKGYVTTLLNRRRYLPDITSRNWTKRSFAERTALNTPIQGTAADIIKLAMLKTSAALKEQRLAGRLLLQVHDELVLEAPREEVEVVCALLKEYMEGAIELDVPLEVDIKLGPNWYQVKEL
ncbi:MAG: DNA polymerase I [bacterium]